MTRGIKIAPKIIVAAMLCSLVSGVCYGSSGGGGSNQTGCATEDYNRSTNVCNPKGLVWMYFEYTNIGNAPKANVSGKNVPFFMMPTSSYDREESQGRTTIVGCDVGFWVLGYPIYQGQDIYYWNLRKNYESYGDGGWHQSRQHWSAGRLDETIFDDWDDDDQTKNRVYWRYTGNSKDGYTWGVTGGRNTNFIGNGECYDSDGSEVSCSSDEVETRYPLYNDNFSGTVGFRLGNNVSGTVKEFAAAKKFGKTNEEVKKLFDKAVKGNHLTAYDKYGEPTGKDPNWDTTANFCWDPSWEDERATFEGSSSAKVRGSDSGQTDQTRNLMTNNAEKVTVKGDKATVTFQQTIKRKNEGSISGAVKAQYWVNGSADLAKNDKTYETNGLAKNASQTITLSKSIDIRPGETKYYWNTLHFYKTATKENNSFKYSSESWPDLKPDNKKCDNQDDRGCISVYREPAKFTGVVTDIKVNGVVKGSGGPYEIEPDANGKYVISFTDTITRRTDDNAGGTAKSAYKVFDPDATGISINDGEGTDTSAMSPGGSVNVATKTKTIELKIGESQQVCQSFYYLNTYNHSEGKKKNLYSQARACITIKRPDVTCAIAKTKNASAAVIESFKYGLSRGRNIGRVGVVNITENGGKTSESDYYYSPINSGTGNLMSTAEIWAKPGDNIKFRHDACAGALYPIASNNLKNGNSSYDMAFTAEGYITKNTATTDATNYPTTNIYNGSTNKDGYLFKASLSKLGDNYYNPATVRRTGTDTFWWSTYSGSGRKFMNALANLEMYQFSPSVATTYSCAVSTSKNPSSSTSFTNTYYQVNGKSGCHSNMVDGSKINDVDVGGVITQKLTWDDITVSNSNSVNVGGRRTASISVSIPYNYTMKPFVSNNDNTGVVYLGGNMNVNIGVATMPRVNNKINGKNAYATVTKKTSVKQRVYIKKSGTNNTIDIDSGTELANRRFNAEGNFYATSENVAANKAIAVPDDGNVAIGDQICVEVTVTPADSHDAPSAKTVYGDIANHSGYNNNTPQGQRAALREYGTSSRTTTSCSTVAKRPTMSVESSNAYSATSFNTSTYTKAFSSTSSKYYFGSWAEYGVFGQVNTATSSIFPSGAAIGYSKTQTHKTLNQARATLQDTATAYEGNVGLDSAANTCVFMTQTFANANCQSGKIGNVSAEIYQNRIIDVYGKEGKDIGTSVGVKDSKKIEGISYHILSDMTVPAIKSPNGYISKVPTDVGNTIIYNISGILIIDGNINDQRGKKMTSLSDIKNVIIIANKVWITDRVDYINATIIAKSELNTCKYISSTMAAVSQSNLNASTCNTSLIFEAPVITKKLILNRTYGAGVGSDSNLRAEIFNLNLTNYLWSYDQMSKYSQAVTTYSRELPTRY